MRRISCLIQALLLAFEQPVRYLFGRDVFISYSRGDASRYAPNLVLALQAKRPKLSFYLDKWIATSSLRPPRSLDRQLRWSSILVLVCTENAIRSTFVMEEIRLFARLRRQIVPIDVGRAFFNLKHDSDIWEQIGGASPESESLPAVESGKPSDHVVERILKSIEFTTQDQRLRRAVWGTLGLILVSLMSAFFYSNRVVNRANKDVVSAQKGAEAARVNTRAAEAEKALADQMRKEAQEETLADTLYLAGRRAASEDEMHLSTAFAAESLLHHDSSVADQLLRTGLRSVPRIRSTFKINSRVDRVTFTADGQRLLIEGGDKVIRSYSIDGRFRGIALDCRSTSRCITGEDGLFAAITSLAGDSVRIMNLSDAKVVTTFSLGGPASQLVLSSGGQYLAAIEDKAGGEDVNVDVWEVATRKRLCHFPQKREAVMEWRFSQNGRLFAVTSKDDLDTDVLRTSQIFETASGTLKVDGLGSSPLAISRNGNFVAGSDSREVEVYQSSLPGSLGEDTALKLQESNVNGIGFSPNEQVLIVSGDAGLRMWLLPDLGKDLNSESTEMGAYSEGWNRAFLGFTPDGHFLMTTDDAAPTGTKVRFWSLATDLKNNVAITQRMRFPTADFTNYAFCPEGRLLATALSDLVTIWDYSDGDTVGSIEFGDEDQEVQAESTISHNGEYFAAMNRTTVSILRVDKMSTVGTVDLATKPLDISMGPDGIHLLSKEASGVKLWDLPAKRVRKQWNGAGTADFSGDGKLIAFGKGQIVHLIWLNSLREYRHFTLDVPVKDVRFTTGDPDTLMTTDNKNNLTAWDVPTGKALSVLKNPTSNHWTGILEGGEFVAKLSSSQAIEVLNARTGKTVGWVKNARGIESTVSRDGKYIATIVPSPSSDSRGIAMVYEVSTGQLWGQVEHEGRINDVQFSADSKYLVSAGDDSRLNIWDVQKREVIASAENESPIERLFISENGKYVIAVGGGSVNNFLWRPIDLIRAACMRNVQVSPEQTPLLKEFCARK